MVEGMKLYGNLLDDTEVKRLVSLVNDLRATGKRGQFQGKSICDFGFDPFILYLLYISYFFYICRLLIWPSVFDSSKTVWSEYKEKILIIMHLFLFRHKT